MPKAAALDFRGQMALSRFAGWMALFAGVALFSGFFRQDSSIRIRTIIFGLAMFFLWVVIAAGHFSVA
jgi:hypothetical protein